MHPSAGLFIEVSTAVEEHPKFIIHTINPCLDAEMAKISRLQVSVIDVCQENITSQIVSTIKSLLNPAAFGLCFIKLINIIIIAEVFSIFLNVFYYRFSFIVYCPTSSADIICSETV